MTEAESVAIEAPGGFVPRQAVAFGSAEGDAVQVDIDHPLPTSAMIGAATSAPLTGSSSASATVGPFTPQLGRPIWLTLSGSWSGTVVVLRSTDGGATKLPLTAAGQGWGAFGANVNEPVGEETVAAARYYLQITLTSGSVTYEVRQ